MFRRSDAPPPPVLTPDQERRISLRNRRSTAWDKLLAEARLQGLGTLLYIYSDIIADALDDVWDKPIAVQRRALKASFPHSEWELKYSVAGKLWKKEVARQRGIRNRQEREWRLKGRVGPSPSELRRNKIPFPTDEEETQE